MAVNQDGDRVSGDDVNILTVIANESYESYVAGLQQEYTDAGDATPPPPSKDGKFSAKRNDDIFYSEDFKKFWKKICQRTDYKINVDSNLLVMACINKLNTKQFPEPMLVISKGRFIMTEFIITLIKIEAGLARLKIEINDTDGNKSNAEHWFRDGNDLAKILKDERLKGFKIVQVINNDLNSKVVFGDKGELFINQSISFHSEKGQKNAPISVQEAQTTYPVFNLIDRTIKETHLTRPTVLKIFKGLDERVKGYIFKNPEGFGNIFINTIRELLADHIADKIEYVLLDGIEEYDIELLFPEIQKYPQKELLEGTEWSLYDQIQIDSDIEKHFVQNRLNIDNNIVCYFKFPYKFKIHMPKIIGNYNPDWGIIRWDSENKRLKLELIRETKGSINPIFFNFGMKKGKLIVLQNILKPFS